MREKLGPQTVSHRKAIHAPHSSVGWLTRSTLNLTSLSDPTSPWKQVVSPGIAVGDLNFGTAVVCSTAHARDAKQRTRGHPSGKASFPTGTSVESVIDCRITVLALDHKSKKTIIGDENLHKAHIGLARSNATFRSIISRIT